MRHLRPHIGVNLSTEVHIVCILLISTQNQRGMFKFFRKIRQRLFTESRFSRYFLYALGEIILVVIGILIALQVNNWNEQRKIQRTNEVLKDKLIGELELNIERLSRLDSLNMREGKTHGLKILMLNTDTAIAFMRQGMDTERALWMAENPLFFYSEFNLHSTVFEEMKSTGRLYALGSDSLIHAIDKYYRRLEREAYYNRTRNERCITRLFECKYGWQLFEMDYQLDGKAATSMHPWLFDPLSAHYLDLKMALHTSNATYRQSHTRITQVIDDSYALIRLLQSEMQPAAH